MPPAPSVHSEPAFEAGQRATSATAKIDLSRLPRIIDMSAESITRNVIEVNSGCPDERFKFIMKGLVTHLHDFVRETSITTEEWLAAIKFLTETGQKCTDIRQEFILFSDVLGASSLVDSLNNAKPPGATESSVLGPFFTEDAHDVPQGGSIASEGKGNNMYPVAHAIIDTWETDGKDYMILRDGPDCRGRLQTSEDGTYAFRAVVPVSYPIPSDGPVGDLISKLARHPFRPAHLHMMIQAPGFEKLTTALYFKGDRFIPSDAVFGVKNSLIVETKTITDSALTRARGFRDGDEHEYLEQCDEVRRKAMPAVPGPK
ncbi:intradiol ring-cleavage dioxygenase [Infundibulicybe gibba]|nr:intradiol ring-cleavage dioxygenase [Infundibulicybe gibba]